MKYALSEEQWVMDWRFSPQKEGVRGISYPSEMIISRNERGLPVHRKRFTVNFTDP